MGPPIMVLSPQGSNGLATGQVSASIRGRIQSCVPACLVECSADLAGLHARSVATCCSRPQRAPLRVLQSSNSRWHSSYNGPLSNRSLPCRSTRRPLNAFKSATSRTRFGIDRQRGSRFLIRSTLDDPAELAEAAHQTGENLASVVEGGAEGLANSGKAIAGAAAAAGVLAGQIGKVVGKTTSLVRDAYGPEVEDQISHQDHHESLNILEQVKDAIPLAKGDVDLEGFGEKLADVSDEVKLAASQAGLAVVTAAGAALKRNEKESRNAYASTAVEEPRKEAARGAMGGATKAPSRQQSGSMENGLPAGKDKKVEKVESLVASQLKLEVSNAGQVLDSQQATEKEGAAVVVVDALKERLADFAGGVEEEIKRKQAEKDAEKQRESERSKEHEERHSDQKPAVRGGPSVGEKGGVRPSRGGLQRQVEATKVRVGRERHIPVNKADLIPAMRDLFEDERDAAGFVAVCTSVESILHAEHQVRGCD